ncbi:MAG: DnaJ domain-containing protein [Deltaproteobacteria bacterium]|nr:DnaJ domain-containing protein [Deltaproteobacteria bacterium]
MAELDPMEIIALARIMDELDYYQLLHVDPEASASEIRKAFHDSSRHFHPDANRRLPHELREQCGRISKRITEAYCVLRDTRRRKSYDAKRGEGSSLRIQLAEARQSHTTQQKAERRGATPQGRQYHAKAETELKAGNVAAAIRHLQMALTFEAGNAGFKAMLDELRARQKPGA